MLHCFPFTGLIDHGFWTVNPTLVFNLAKANHYQILYMTLSVINGPFRWLDPATARTDLRTLALEGSLPQNAWLHVVYRKHERAEFRVPRQEIYSECPDPVVVEAWKALR